MKKFDRLPPEQRREEICTAALRLFADRGFSATTMENIVEQVSLSKGGVYRFYSSTAAILSDLMLQGMRLRNAWYAQQVRQRIEAGKPLTLPFLLGMIGDSLLLYPEFSAVYVEFLWEKQRNPGLEALYREICRTTVEETGALIRQYDAQSLLTDQTLNRLTELMNAAVLSMRVLNLQESFSQRRDAICKVMTQLLEN